MDRRLLPLALAWIWISCGSPAPAPEPAAPVVEDPAPAPEPERSDADPMPAPGDPDPQRSEDPPAPARTTYTWIFLESGTPTASHGADEMGRMQEQHVGNLTRLAHEGLNLMAGPLAGSRTMRGIVLLDLDPGSDLTEPFAPDPFVEHGYLVPRALSWKRTHGDFAPLPEDPQMTDYLFVLARPVDGSDRQTGAEAFRALEEELGGSGELRLAGPFLDGELSGVLILDCEDAEATEADVRAAAPVAFGDLAVDVYVVWLVEGLFV